MKTLGLSLLQGGGVLGAVLGMLLYAKWANWPEGEARALAFAGLAAGNLMLALANRSWSAGLVPERRFRNPIMAAMLLAVPFLLAAVIYVPWIAGFFRFEPLRGSGLLWAALGAVLSLLWGLGVKKLGDSRKRSAAA